MGGIIILNFEILFREIIDFEVKQIQFSNSNL